MPTTGEAFASPRADGEGTDAVNVPDTDSDIAMVSGPPPSGRRLRGSAAAWLQPRPATAASSATAAAASRPVPSQAPRLIATTAATPKATAPQVTEPSVSDADADARLATALRNLRATVMATVVACFDIDCQVTALWSLGCRDEDTLARVERLGTSVQASVGLRVGHLYDICKTFVGHLQGKLSESAAFVRSVALYI